MSNASPTQLEPHTEDGKSRRSRAGSSRSARNRHRASTACVACRERRIRCIVPAGEQECVRCQRVKATCVIRDDDERKRRKSAKEYTEALAERVSFLESMLRERDGAVTSVAGSNTNGGHGDIADGTTPYEDTPSRSPLPAAGEHLAIQSAAGFGTPHRPDAEQTRGVETEAHSSLLRKLLSTNDRIQHHDLTDRESYYGPTANCHVLAEAGSPDLAHKAAIIGNEEQAHAVIRALPLETHDYLMTLFWEHHNDVLFVIHRPAFDQDRHAGKLRFYSAFLHLCVLAMGYRFADKSRSDVQALSRSSYESGLHQEAKRILASGLDALGGIPAIAALLILSDLEVGVGRAEVGWIYTGIALRLCTGMGLHLGTGQRNSELESMARIRTLRACFVADCFWSLFLGRPTMHISLASLSKSSVDGNLIQRDMPESEKTLSMWMNESLLSLMTIAGRIIDDREHCRQEEVARHASSQSSYLRMAKIDRDLRNWLTQLPTGLQSTRENLATGPYSIYLLHQQYYALLVMLHRPFACYDGSVAPSHDENSLDSHFLKASREICLKSALAMASLFRQHRQRFHGRRTFRMGMQQAGTGATALIAAMIYHTDIDRNNVTQCLATLHLALRDMAIVFRPASDMVGVIDAAVREMHHSPALSNRNMDSNNTITYASQHRYDPHMSGAQPTSVANAYHRSLHPAETMSQTQQWITSAAATSPVAFHHDRAHVGACDAIFLPTMDADAQVSPGNWEFQSIDEMMGVPGLPNGDLVDLLDTFDQHGQGR